MKLVGERDPAHVERRMANVFDISLLPRPPRRFGGLVGVRAAFHNPRNPVSEAPADIPEATLTSLIFDDIMQQGRDDLIFVPAVFQY